jgi:signal transduction histidine kinase
LVAVPRTSEVIAERSDRSDEGHDDVRAACARSAAVIRAALGPACVSARIILPDAAGMLRVVHADGDSPDTGRLRSSRRRAVFATGERAFVRLPAYQCSLALFPLLGESRVEGVAEIVVRDDGRLHERADLITALAAQSGHLIWSARQKREAERALNAMTGLLHFTADLIRARTVTQAVGAAAAACYGQLGRPVTALLHREHREGWGVVAVHGLGKRRRAELKRALRSGGIGGGAEQMTGSLRITFADISGYSAALGGVARQAVLLAAGGEGAEVFETIRHLLAERLQHIEEVAVARRRTDQLDLGIAWTAHELRAPLTGARVALDYFLTARHRSEEEGRRLISRTRTELQEMSDVVDPLLRWASGVEHVHREPIDVMQVVWQSVSAATVENDRRRIRVRGPVSTYVAADRVLLRSAIVNLLRNALSYSPEGSPIRLSVVDEERAVGITITDRGPGISAQEREGIFEPYSRGAAGRRGGQGTGLGLFVVRRAIEAHGGTLSVEPSREGAAFRIEIPVDRRPISES